ncbi:protein kinase domain-containing protein [Colletotrichum truncatum]|uniref:Protein kinase domain-containing protein n=1 Tax=Colletotrichum truncatum TaxID=5467 RepID=A0ACC3YSI6_COLTU
MAFSDYHGFSCPRRAESSSSGNSPSSSIFSRRYASDFNCECQSAIYSRHNEFSGGPEVIIHDTDGKQKPADQSGSQGRKHTASETSDTRTVVSVYDLGLNKTRSASKLASGGGSQPTVGSIRERVEKSLQLSQFDQKEYLPLDAFEDIFTLNAIQSVIIRSFPKCRGRRQRKTRRKKVREKVSEIWGETGHCRRRIFGILFYMGALHLMDDFIKERIFDDDLPLRRVYTVKAGFKTRDRTERDDVVNTRLMGNWKRNEVDLFYINQSRFYVPFFDSQSKDLLSHVFDSNVRLPWQHYQRKTNGGNGVVYKVKIHPSHHNFKGFQSPDNELYFAVKEIDSMSREVYHDEIRALEKANAKAQKEKHLIQLLLTFQHGEKLFLLFEWADGNLLEFWEEKTLGLSPSLTHWVAQQCLGIATAIKRIHGLSTWQKRLRSSSSSETSSDTERDWGRHGDIKPNNILWFSRHGNDTDLLVVSDLGLTRFHSRLTKSLVSRVDGYTGAYRAPEIDMDLRISQKYDVWSLGCVFFEFCVWYLLGPRSLTEFEDDRHGAHQSDIPSFQEDCYFIIRHEPHKHAELNPAVIHVCSNKSLPVPVLLNTAESYALLIRT